MYAWINALGNYPENAVNKRAEPSTSSAIVGGLNSLGEFVTVLEEDEKDDGVWTHYQGVKSGENFWVREDVYKGVIFGSSTFHKSPLQIIALSEMLDLKYHSQNDQDSNMSPNDCGPASSTMMLERAGISVTVNDFMVKAGINHTGFTNFNDNIRGIERYYLEDGTQLDAEYRRPVHVSDVLSEVGDKKNPIFCLIYYAQLNAGKNYGHFLVAVGYEIVNNSLKIILHDPNRGPYMRFPIEDFADALGYVGGYGNLPFQAMVIKNYPAPDVPEVPEIPEVPEVPELPIPPDHGTDGPDGADFEKAMLIKMDTIIALLLQQNKKLDDIYAVIPED